MEKIAIGSEGDSNGYLSVVKKFRALRTAASGLMEEADRLARRMRANASLAERLADLTAAADADPRHVTAIAEVGAAFGSVASNYSNLVGAADTVHAATDHLASEHQAEYGGIHAAVTSSRVRQAKPGFYRST